MGRNVENEWSTFKKKEKKRKEKRVAQQTPDNTERRRKWLQKMERWKDGWKTLLPLCFETSHQNNDSTSCWKMILRLVDKNNVTPTA